MRDRRARALHEARHAIVCIDRGIAFERVSVTADPTGVASGYVELVSGNVSAFDYLCMVIAGPIAWPWSAFDVRQLTGKDAFDAAEALEAIHGHCVYTLLGDQVFYNAVESAQQTLRKYWGAVHHVADLLLIHTELTGDAVRSAIANFEARERRQLDTKRIDQWENSPNVCALIT